MNLNTILSANELLHMQTGSGEGIFSFMPTKRYQSIVFSSPDLKKDTSYDVYLGGASTGSFVDGLNLDGAYTPGSKYVSFTVSSISTKISVR